MSLVETPQDEIEASFTMPDDEALRRVLEHLIYNIVNTISHSRMSDPACRNPKLAEDYFHLASGMAFVRSHLRELGLPPELFDNPRLGLALKPPSSSH